MKNIDAKTLKVIMEDRWNEIERQRKEIARLREENKLMQAVIERLQAELEDEEDF
jgi:hypothetical protein